MQVKNLRSKLVLLTAFLLAILIVVPTEVFAQSKKPELFQLGKKTATSKAERKAKGWVVSRTPITFNFAATKNNRFNVALPNGKFVAVKRDHQSSKNSKSVESESISGDLFLEGSSSEDGQYTLSLVKESGKITGVAGLISTKGKDFSIVSHKGSLVLEEIDHSKFPECKDNHQHDSDPTAFESSGDASAAEQVSSVVNVLVLYSPQARSARGGTANMLAAINSAISLANTGYARSNVPMVLNLVHAQETVDSETGDFDADLSKLRTVGDGVFDEVHALRDQYSADLVALINNNNKYCGIGYLFNNSSAYGFSVTYQSCITNYTFHHELGHNMGLHHDRQNAGSGAYQPYSYGHRFTGTSGQVFRTVMAYAPGARINNFSNPEILYDGVATGIAHSTATSTTSADNARTLNITGPLVSAFRSEPGECLPSTPSMTISPRTQYISPGQTGQYAITITNRDTSCPSLNFSLSLASSNGASGSLSSSTLTIESGKSASVTLSLSLAAAILDGQYDASVTASATGRNSVTSVATAVVDTAAAPAISDLTASSGRKSTVQLKWSQPATGIVAYHIYRNNVFKGTTTQLSYSDSQTSSGSTYSYFVVSEKQNGAISDPSNIATITVGSSSTGGGGSTKGGPRK